MTPIEIEEELNLLTSDTLPKLNEELDGLATDLENKKHIYEMSAAKEVLEIKVSDIKYTVKETEARIYDKHAESILELNLAEVKYKSLVRKINVITTRIDVLRSQLSYKKAELERTA